MSWFSLETTDESLRISSSSFLALSLSKVSRLNWKRFTTVYFYLSIEFLYSFLLVFLKKNPNLVPIAPKHFTLSSTFSRPLFHFSRENLVRNNGHTYQKIGTPIHLEVYGNFPHQFLSLGENHHSLTLQVPGLWNGVLGSGKGYGSYRLKLTKPDGINSDLAFGIKTLDQATASRVYWNGELLGGAGVVSKDPSLGKPSYGSQIYSVRFKEGENELVLNFKLPPYQGWDVGASIIR